jgi:hypothetical protein
MRAFFDEKIPEAERLAARQAVAAALRRRASSGGWTKMAEHPDDRVDGFIRAFAVALVLDPNRPDNPERAGIPSPTATRDRSKTLHGAYSAQYAPIQLCSGRYPPSASRHRHSCSLSRRAQLVTRRRCSRRYYLL